MNEAQNKAIRQQLIKARIQYQNAISQKSEFVDSVHSRILMVIDKIATIYPSKIQNIAFYWPIHGELDLREALLQWSSQDSDRKLALPITKPQQALRFYQWDKDTPMQNGFANILEPVSHFEVQPDLIIAPCVGWFFSAHTLWRIGYGGGYYDRTLEKFKKSGHQPFFLGTALTLQKLDASVWEPQEHDHPLDGLFTESSVYISGETLA